MRRARAAIVLVAIVGCAVYDTSLLVDASASDASPDAQPDVVVDPCNHAEPPARPATNDPSDADIELVNAIASVDFNITNDAGAVYGFDLDHTCTCPAPESCVPQQGSQTHCDDPQGRDNAGGALIQQFSQLTTELDANQINTKFAQGLSTMMLRVRNYNGTPNDTQVALAVLVSNGTMPLTDAGDNPPPKHDGTDTWGIDPSSLVGSPPPYLAVNEDASAYVTNGVLVASVSFPFGIGTAFGPNFLRLDGALLVATVTKVQTGFALAGIVTGRWDTRNLLTGMQGVHDPLSPSDFLCGTDPTYQGFKKLICAASDISRLGSSDNTGAPCDAISLAVGFTAETALLGPLLSGNPKPTPCGATYTDQCGN